MPSPVPAHLIMFPDDAEPSVGEKLKPKVLKTETAESCKAKRSSSKCSSSTSLSSSTTPASSSTASSIVSLAEGEAATSFVLQDDVSSVLRYQG